MASGQLANLYNAAITTDTTTNGDRAPLQPRVNAFIGWLQVSGFTAGTFDAKIQHSPDGTNWVDLVTFTQATGNTTEAVNVTANVFHNVRAQIVSASSADATVKVQLWYDENK